MKIYPAIMCGGSGTRLWPLSRRLLPKQFIALVNQTTMLQDTLGRLPSSCQQPIFICNEAHRFTVAEQINAVDNQGSILLEPQGKNTAPAVALAAFKAIAEDDDAVLLVLAADHVIHDQLAFQNTVVQAQAAAEAGKLVTFGIVPTKPETGYGYIKHGVLDQGIADVDTFVEKPNLATAQAYLASGQYLWNSGMFMFKASRYLAELNKYRPNIYQACQAAMSDCVTDLDFIRPNKAAFKQCPDESIDYAVMEHTEQAVVVPLDAGWSDVGSYSALWEVSEQDQDGNVCKGDVLTHETSNSYLHSDNKLIATVGIDNLVVIDTSDAVLVAEKSQVQQVKHIVNELKLKQRSEVDHHRQVYRPWGSYDSIDNGSRFQVKRIVVKPGAKLSVQMHHHRAEHWIVVSGTAKVTINDDTFLMTENESTYIPVGAVHALENPGKLPLEMIEVQSGSYLGEDDIVRLEDRYGREQEQN
ncbi:mannose-1-phosphate guanylyltransferase/mannose-6-phosphate isomerase [Thalassotalea euphylliae]|uniref:mannose-1-phosphate guanylyltransferase n=1 Tax=Thalassotalea euphylliae TaxID=1655234 RepID=A0A3E0UJL7_9GAMM|nr:mannose-1-phosphate guanylyltransferase/mannose-6-phosphate isomerase [Thalassotalea euphylliae]REL37066.1 mannose-1-phosphate guanylyltransferase/mannose-6-phosphate isomerase [Thalassotalea euphylliae]